MISHLNWTFHLLFMCLLQYPWHESFRLQVLRNTAERSTKMLAQKLWFTSVGNHHRFPGDSTRPAWREFNSIGSYVKYWNHAISLSKLCISLPKLMSLVFTLGALNTGIKNESSLKETLQWLFFPSALILQINEGKPKVMIEQSDNRVSRSMFLIRYIAG